VSVLTGPEIKRLATGGTNPQGQRIVIDPFDPACVGPASYDLHLGDELRWYDLPRGEALDPLHPPATRESPSVQGWRIEPGRVYLACTREYTETHGMAAQVAGRSSWGRYGLFVHVTAGFIDPGFCGRITLELVATQSVIVRPGDLIAQIVYSTIMGEYQPYKGRYQHDTGPTASRFHLPTPANSNMGEGE
jgi:dCTP deaminase